MRTRGLKSIPVAPLVAEWQRAFGIDVRGEFGEVREINTHRCDDCTLVFFKPDSMAGSPSLYEALERFDWYYKPHKWEHDVAVKNINDSANGIEIGCGFGDFIARVVKSGNIAFEGCEQNPSAIKVARRKGLQVHGESIEDLAQRRPQSYDVVCAFQVLEHVKQPGAFIQAACTLLRPGGKLMLGLPNAESFLKYQFNLLDLPPHHMTRWTKEALTRLPSWFPLKLDQISCEPLADYHLQDYVNAYANLLSRSGFRFLDSPRVQTGLVRLIRAFGVRKLLRGQSLYASFNRV